MSRRRPRPARPVLPHGVAGGIAHQDVEAWPDGTWVVRRLSGSGSAKAYRCPGCQQLIPPVTPHLVAWPAGSDGGHDGNGARAGLEERRHWHPACWRARDRRGPT